MNDIVKIFIGFDSREAISYSVYAYSLFSQSSKPVQITPILSDQNRNILDRPWDPKQSNDFAFTRWLVPYFCDFKGWAAFTDLDMLCRGDIVDLWNMRDPVYTVQVVKHNYQPKEPTKYLGNLNSRYKRKNWSSVILFNCEKCKQLTPEYIQTASGLDLHQFKWIKKDSDIGGLPKRWNHLVGVYPYDSKAKLVHWTNFGPWLFDHVYEDYGVEWRQQMIKMMKCEDSNQDITECVKIFNKLI